ncbi:MAG: TaqI-like C-terminal specificity domain-containing protein [Candidatus Hodarchaeales archaeon]
MGKHNNINFQKELGAFYTPAPLVKELTEKALSLVLISQINEELNHNFSTIDEVIITDDLNIIKTLLRKIDKLTILDGSVGDGRFLISASEYLFSIHEEIIKTSEKKLGKILSSYSSYYLKNLYGMEIDLSSVKICNENLENSISHKRFEVKLKNVIAKNVVVGNFLKSKYTDWSRLPKDFQGFDIIIGNPPWGSKLSRKEKDYFFEKFQLRGSKRNLNAFELFVYQSDNLLSSKNGILALYLPKNLARSNQYTNLREFLLQKYELYSLNFFERFQNVTQEFISIIGKKAIEINPTHEILINNKRKLQQKVFQTNTDYIFTLEVDESDIRKLKIINSDSIPLEQFLTVKRGEELSKKGGIMFCNVCNTWVPLSSRKPDIECSNCLTKIKSEELQKQFLINKTQTSEHQKPILTGEDFDKYLIIGNHFFNNSINFRTKKNSEIYRSPKIVVQKIKRYPWAAYDQKERLTTQNVYILHLKEELAQQIDILFYILAILNSRLMTWYYEKQFNLGSKFTNAISIRNLKRLPIKNPNKNKKVFLEIVEQVKKLLTSKEVFDIQSQVESVDILISELYGWKEDQ